MQKGLAWIGAGLAAIGFTKVIIDAFDPKRPLTSEETIDQTDYDKSRVINKLPPREIPEAKQTVEQLRKENIDTGSPQFNDWGWETIKNNKPFLKIAKESVKTAQEGQSLLSQGEIALLDRDVTIIGKVGVGLYDTETGDYYRFDKITEALKLNEMTHGFAITDFVVDKTINPDARFVLAIDRDADNHVEFGNFTEYQIEKQVYSSYEEGKKGSYMKINLSQSLATAGDFSMTLKNNIIEAYILDKSLETPNNVKAFSNDPELKPADLIQKGQDLLKKFQKQFSNK